MDKGGSLQGIGDVLIPETMKAGLLNQALRNKLIDENNQRTAISHTIGGRDSSSADPTIDWNPDAAPTGTYQAKDADGNWQRYSLFDGPMAGKLPTQDDNTPSLFNPRMLADQQLQTHASLNGPTTDDGASLFQPNKMQAVALQAPVKPDSQSLFGDTTPPPPSLFNDIPALRDMPSPKQQAQDFTQSQMNYLRQAAPDSFLSQAVTQATMLPRLKAAGLNNDQINAFLIDPKNAGEALAKVAFPQQPDELRLIKGLQTQLSGMDASDPNRKPLENLLQKTTSAEWQNPLFQQKTMAEIAAALARAQHYGVQDQTRTLFKDMPQELQGDDAINWVKANVPNGNAIAAIAANVAAGKVKKPTMGRPGSQSEAVNSLLNIAYPDLSDIDLGNRFDLAKQLNNQQDTALGGKLNTTEKIINHSVGLLNSALDLDNGTIRAGNYIRNFVRGQNSDAALKAFQLNQGGLGNEFEKLSGGGKPGETSKAEAQGYYDSNAGLPGTLGAVGKTVELMEGQIDPVVGNYNRVYGTNYDTEGFIRDVLKQPAVADKLHAMKGIADQYMRTKKIDQGTIDSIRALKSGVSLPGSAQTPGGQGGEAGASTVPPAAVAYLKSHPELSAQFDAKYGMGAAKAALGQ